MAAILPKSTRRFTGKIDYTNHLVQDDNHTYRVCLSKNDRLLIIALKTPLGNERYLLHHRAKAKRLKQLALNAKYAAQQAG